MWKRLRNRLAPVPPAAPSCRTACPLSACAAGCRAAVLRMECDGGEARRLRNLGLFEGAFVTVVEKQGGLLLEVKGARLALGTGLAAAIQVLPLPT